MSVDIADTMDALAAAMLTVTGISRAYAYPTEGILPICAVVGYPEGDIDLSVTAGRGADRAAFPVWVVCGLQYDKTTRQKVTDFVNGASNVWSAINASATLLAMGSIRVFGASVEGWTLADPSVVNPPVYTAVKFVVEVTA